MEVYRWERVTLYEIQDFRAKLRRAMFAAGLPSYTALAARLRSGYDWPKHLGRTQRITQPLLRKLSAALEVPEEYWATPLPHLPARHRSVAAVATGLPARPGPRPAARARILAEAGVQTDPER